MKLKDNSISSLTKRFDIENNPIFIMELTSGDKIGISMDTVFLENQTKEMKIKKIVDKTILTKTDGTNKITIKNYIKFFNSDKIKDIELFTSLVDNKYKIVQIDSVISRSEISSIEPLYLSQSILSVRPNFRIKQPRIISQSQLNKNPFLFGK